MYEQSSMMAENRTFHTLIVEDNPNDVNLIYELVAEAGSVQFTWNCVLELHQAKEILRAEPFDLVLLDLFLPDSQGLDTLIHLYPHAVCLPVVVLTERDDELIALQAVRSGAQDYLVKGQIAGQSLVRTLCYAMERKRLEIALRVQNQQLTALTQRLSPRAQLGSSMDDLIVSLVQELNNPLARVRLKLEDLLGQFEPNDVKRAALQAIQAEIEFMGRLVGRLLQVAAGPRGAEDSMPNDPAQHVLGYRSDSSSSEEAKFFEALGAWAWDYISRNKTVSSGSIDHFLQQVKKSQVARYEPLSQREQQVIYLIAKGHTNKEIAKELSLSVRTIERYSSSVMNKLGLHNRAELITYAVRAGIVNGSDIHGAK